MHFTTTCRLDRRHRIHSGGVDGTSRAGRRHFDCQRAHRACKYRGVNRGAQRCQPHARTGGCRTPAWAGCFGRLAVRRPSKHKCRPPCPAFRALHPRREAGRNPQSPRAPAPITGRVFPLARDQSSFGARRYSARIPPRPGCADARRHRHPYVCADSARRHGSHPRRVRAGHSRSNHSQRHRRWDARKSRRSPLRRSPPVSRSDCP